MKKVSNPLISVIIPVYKVEKYLEKCVDSVINQTYDNLEIILVDDGSPDNCPKMCDEYAKKDKRIKVIHKENGGLSDARNVGIKNSNGEYIGFVDSDDWVSKDMYKDLYNLIIKTQSDIAISEIIRTNDESVIINNIDEIITEFNQKEYLKRYFKIGFQTTEYYAVNKLYKRNIIKEDQYPIGLTSEDVFGTYKAILNAKKIVKTNKIHYFYRYNENSITGKFSKKDFDLLKIWDKVVEYTKKTAPQYIEYAQINRIRINYTLLVRMAINLDYNDIMNNYKAEYTNCFNDLKNNKKVISKAKMSFARRLSLLLILINYHIFCVLVRLLIKCRRKHEKQI